MAHINEERMKPLRSMVGERHSSEKLWAALSLLGFQPEDLLPISTVSVDAQIPQKERAEQLKKKKQESLDGVRQERLRRLQDILTVITEQQVARYRFAGDGIRVVRPEELDDKQVLSSGIDFEELKRERAAKVQAEQQRQATNVCTSFLMEKKATEENDANIAAMEQRLQAFRKEQEDIRKARAKERDQATEKRNGTIRKAKEEREEWENETLRKLEEKVAAAHERRMRDTMGFDKNSQARMAEKQEAARQKRRQAFQRAVELEQRGIDRIEEKRVTLETRMEEARDILEQELADRAQMRQDKFQKKQLDLIHRKEEWAENTLKQHTEFMAKCKTAQEGAKAAIKERSKSTGDLTKKAQERSRTNNEKLRVERESSGAATLERHAKASEHVAATRELGLKCGVDVHTNKEAKGIMKELQTLRVQELRRKRDAKMQATLVRLAEHQKRSSMLGADREQLWHTQQKVMKDSLTLADNSREGFLKIMCTSDEGKIRQVMGSLGFEMPRLKVEDEAEEEGGQKAKPAY